MTYQFNVAPIVYILLQIVLFGLCCYEQNRLLDLTRLEVIFLWIDIPFTLVFYFITHFRDPGFVRQQEMHPTDLSQNQQKKKQSQSIAPIAPNHQILPNQISTQNTYNQKSDRHHHMEEQDKLKKNQQDERLDNEPSSELTPKDQNRQNDDPEGINIQKIFNSKELIQDPQKLTIKGKLQALNESFVEIQLQAASPTSNLQNCKIPQSMQVYIEKRLGFCPFCQQDQLLRSKHCIKCKKCVACYDHHCPWMGNCIGERNKCPFYWYLIFQLIQMTITYIEVLVINYNFEIFYWNDFSSRECLPLVALLLVIAAFYLMILALFFFHSFLAFRNLTTWEHASWHKISYLKDLPESLGSPFSRGVVYNLKMFCRCKVQKLTVWDFNLSNNKFY